MGSPAWSLPVAALPRGFAPTQMSSPAATKHSRWTWRSPWTLVQQTRIAASLAQYPGDRMESSMTGPMFAERCWPLTAPVTVLPERTRLLSSVDLCLVFAHRMTGCMTDAELAIPESAPVGSGLLRPDSIQVRHLLPGRWSNSASMVRPSRLALAGPCESPVRSVRIKRICSAMFSILAEEPVERLDRFARIEASRTLDRHPIPRGQNAQSV